MGPWCESYQYDVANRERSVGVGVLAGVLSVCMGVLWVCSGCDGRRFMS